MINIVCDMMGADKSQAELLEGVVRAINENNDLFVSIFGNKDEIDSYLNTVTYNKDQVAVFDSTEVVTNMDIPTRAFRTKPDSSLIKGLNYAKDNADGFVSCGSTGAVLVSSTFILGKVGEARPALATELLTENGTPLLLLDCGANVECKKEMLLDFAKMGVSYMESIGMKNPRVALLANGAEEKKGTELVKETNALLKESKLNFIGNVEGTTLLTGICDIVVCDGYSGNICLKSIEGAAKMIFKDFMIYAKKNNNNDVMKALGVIVNKYDFNSQGGALLLGVNKPVVKGHGAANSQTYYSIIKMAYKAAKGNMVEKFKSLL